MEVDTRSGNSENVVHLLKEMASKIKSLEDKVNRSNLDGLQDVS